MREKVIAVSFMFLFAVVIYLIGSGAI